MSQKKNCFVIMPFTPDLHYFYLYLKDHIEKNQNIICERADEQVLTVQILEKILDFIQKADVVIADCSGRNPNVFYELGIAHATGKKAILITHDPIAEAPSDIKSYEFIPYTLGKHVEFLTSLDNALLNVFVKDYDELYAKALEIFNSYKTDSGENVTMNSKEAFLSLVTAGEASGDLPSSKDEGACRHFLLPRIVKESMNSSIMKSITSWLASKDSAVSQ